VSMGARYSSATRRHAHTLSHSHTHSHSTRPSTAPEDLAPSAGGGRGDREKHARYLMPGGAQVEWTADGMSELGEGSRGRGGGTRGRGGDTYSRVLTVEEGHAGLEVTLAFDFCFRITNGWTESHIY